MKTTHRSTPRVARAIARRGSRIVAVATIGVLVASVWGVGVTASAANATTTTPTPTPASTDGATPATGAADGEQPTGETSAPAEPSAEPEPTGTTPASTPTPAPSTTQPTAPVKPSVEPEPLATKPAPTPVAEPTSEPAVTDEESFLEFASPLTESDRAPPSVARAAGDISILAAGIAEAPREVWGETFEQGLTSTASLLTGYASGRFTHSAGWVSATNCTGVLVNYLAPYSTATICPVTGVAPLRNSTTARETRRLADVLGQVAAGVPGSTSTAAPAYGSSSAAQVNHALTAEPSSTVSGGTTVAQTTSAIGVSAPASRYYAVRMNAAAAQCGTNNASLSLNLVSGTTPLLTGFGSAIIPCTNAAGTYFTSPATATLGLFDPALSGPVRAATYTGTNAALLTPAQISGATVLLSNSVSGAGSAFAVDNLRVLEVTPALDMEFDSASATATVPSTLTYTITNTSDLIAKTDWGFSTALPTGLVVAPTPAVSGSCANVTGAAFNAAATAGASTLAVSGGDLATNATSCTISVDVVAATAGTYSSGTVTPAGLIVSDPASVTAVAPSTITVRKNLPARTVSTDQFTLSLRSGLTAVATATTTGTALGIQAAQINRAVVQAGAVYTIHEAQTTGAGLGYANSYECTRAGTVIASGAGAAGTITMPTEAGAEVVCTFTNTAQANTLFCDTNHFYSITPTGALQQGDIVTGTQSPLGTWPNATAANALGIAAGGTVAYALQRSTDATDVSAILKWTPGTGAGTGFQTIANSSYTTTANGTAITGSLVAGAVDLTNNRYLFGTFVNSQFYIWSFTESNPVASRFAFVGSFPTGTAPNGNGDMAFDARGNLYVVGAATVNNASSAAIYTVTAATLSAASGGTLAVNTSLARNLVGTDQTFTNVNGIAFSPRGTVYLANAGSAYEFDATTWTRVPGTARVPVDSVDLAGCASPSTITVQKNIVGRQVAADQFQLTASAGSPATAFATATTTGTTTGRQVAQIGPFPTPTGSTVTIAEAMAAGTSPITAYTTIYECWADGVRLSTGTTPTGTVTMPNTLNASVNCTYFNSPRPAATVRITKTIQEFSGLTRPGVDWTVGMTATATTGTATALPSEVLTQRTDAAGQAGWTVLFGSQASRATVTVSEVQQTGFVFVSGSCTVNGVASGATFTQVGTTVSASVTGVLTGAAVECAFVNRPTSSLTLVKSVAFGAAVPTDWVLTATAPAGALAGPSGRSGTAAASGIPVTPGAVYRLSESGGPLTYVQVGTWQCRTATGATVAVSAAGDVTPTSGVITCTVTNSTAAITLLEQIQRPQPGFQASDWRVTATPAALAGGTLATETRAGAEYVAAGNPASTFAVRPGHSYTLSEAAADPNRWLAYQELRLEQLVGSTWTPVASRTISAPAAGQTAIYRFVNAPVEPTQLPLTGGTSTDAYLIGGGLTLTLAFALLLWHSRRRMRGAFR